ncbi:MAG: hypothetical protein WA001_05580 [Patescibacteria group bacterium]
MSDATPPRECPFCGDQGSVYAYAGANQNRIVCQVCGFDAPFSRWNSRPLEDRLRVEMEEAKLAREMTHNALSARIAALSDELADWKERARVEAEQVEQQVERIAELTAENDAAREEAWDAGWQSAVGLIDGGHRDAKQWGIELTKRRAADLARLKGGGE